MIRVLVGLCVVLVGVMTLGATPLEAQATRLGYINIQRLLAEAPGSAEAQASFERDLQMYTTELERMADELESLQDTFERQQATMTPAIREQRQAEMQQRFIAYQQRQMELEDTAERRRGELLGPIMDRILEVTELVRQEGNYAVIFDATSGVFVTADPSLDVTDQVLNRLRGS